MKLKREKKHTQKNNDLLPIYLATQFSLFGWFICYDRLSLINSKKRTQTFFINVQWLKCTCVSFYKKSCTCKNNNKKKSLCYSCEQNDEHTCNFILVQINMTGWQLYKQNNLCKHQPRPTLLAPHVSNKDKSNI